MWREFLNLREAGMTRAVGVSNFSLAQIDTLISKCGEAPVINQVPWSPARYDGSRLTASRERDVVVEGYSPLKGTNLADPVLTDIAARHGATPAQVVLRWHLEHGIPVIPKSAQPARIAANINLLGFSLSPDEVASIDSLSGS
jgi:diketogulonate reductase-like aldo/keto reductase